MQVRVTENENEFGKCGCGRSPNGKCIGWHGLTEEQWIEGKTQMIHMFESGQINVQHVQADEEWDNLDKDNK